MDDFLIFLIALFCGDGQALPPDPVLLALFQDAGQAAVSCVDPDERIRADYPRLLLSGEEGEQNQTGDGDAKFFQGSVRLEIVTRQSDAVPDELELLAQLKARCTALLLGDPNAVLPPMQGRNFSGGGAAYNVSVFSQVRPSGRLPAEDPTVKRWGATYRVKLCRLNLLGAVAASLSAPSSAPSIQSQLDALTQKLEDLTAMSQHLAKLGTYTPSATITASTTLTKPTQNTTYPIDTTSGAVVITLYASTGDGMDLEFVRVAGPNPVTFILNTTAPDTCPLPLVNCALNNIGEVQSFREMPGHVMEAH